MLCLQSWYTICRKASGVPGWTDRREGWRENRMGAYKIVRTPTKLLRLCRAYFDKIRYEEPQYQLVQTGISNKGKPIYERQPILHKDEDGREVQLTVTRWIRPPTLEGLCASIPISQNTWERYAKEDGYREVCQWAKEICKAVTLERGLNGEASAQLTEFILENAYGMKKEIMLHGVGFEDWLRTYRNEGPEM